MRILEIKGSLFSKITSGVTIVAIVLVTSFAPQFAKTVNAASLTAMKDTLSPATGAFNAEKASTVANHTIVFTTPTGIANSTVGALVLTFDNSTSIDSSLTFADIDLDDDGSPITLAGTAGASTYKVVRTSATVITFDSQTSGTAIAGGSVITIRIGTNATTGGTGTFQITNGSAGTTLLAISGAFGDTGTIGIPIIADDVVVVNALVTPSISFTVSDNTIFFGNLKASGSSCWAQGTDPGAVTCPTVTETESFNMTAGTNATSGYIITLQGAALTSGANVIDSITLTNTSPSIGTEQFGIRATATGGSGAVTAPYAASGYAYPVSLTPSQVASASGPSATTTYSIREIANIAAVTPSGIYNTSQTFVATATY
jgi:hypothetical protein